MGGGGGGEGGTVGFFLEEFGVESGGWALVWTLIWWGVGVTGGVFAVPALGGGEVYEGEGDLFGVAAALGGDETNAGAGDGVAHDDLVGAVLEDEAGTVGRLSRGLRGGGGALGELRGHAGWGEKCGGEEGGCG